MQFRILLHVNGMAAGNQKNRIIRRVGFFLVLLIIPSVSVRAANPFLGPFVDRDGQEVLWLAIRTFAQSWNRTTILFIAWVVLRAGALTTWQGWVRLTLYASAAVGGLLLIDYEWSAFPDLVARRLIFTWVAFPVVLALNIRLRESEPTDKRIRMTVGSLAGWTLMTALILGWIRFFSGNDPSEKYADYAAHIIPGAAIDVVTLLFLVLACSHGKWGTIFCLPGACLLNYALNLFRVAADSYLGMSPSIPQSPTDFGGALVGLGFYSAQPIMLWLMIVAAAVTGLRYRRFADIDSSRVSLSGSGR